MKLLLSSLLLMSTTVFARPTKIDLYKNVGVKPATAEELYNLASTRGCSAGYVDIGRSLNDRAVILTNGHCTDGSLVANQAWFSLPVSKTFSIFLQSGKKLDVIAIRLLYATLMDTDIAFYELRETNAELQSKGLVPFAFYKGEAPVGSQIRVTSGYWKETQECTLERKVHKLLEGFGSDTSKPSIATDAFAMSKDCNIRGGYSGTPVIDTATNTVIAIAFTGSDGNSACAEASPCEEDEQGRRVYRKGVSYAARVNQVEGCIENGNFNLALPTCTLYKNKN